MMREGLARHLTSIQLSRKFSIALKLFLGPSVLMVSYAAVTQSS